MIPVKSYVKSIVAFSSAQHRFFDFIDRQGPNGGRMVIDGFWVHAAIQCDITVATLDGRDLPRIFSNITISQVDGVQRFNLAGDLARVYSYAVEGPDHYIENADIVVANNNVIKVSLYVPMKKRYAHTPEDFSLPVDMFKELSIQEPAAADFPTATFSLDTCDYWVVADCREDFDVQIYNVDEVASTLFAATTEAQLSLGGKLHDLYLQAAGAGGGASLANLTDVRIDALGFPTLTRNPDLNTRYKRYRNEGNSGSSANGAERSTSPFGTVATAKACAVIFHHDEISPWTGKVLRQAKINLTNSVASLRAIQRVITPATEALRNMTNAAYGKRPGDYRVATKAKTKYDVTGWPKALRPFLRLKASL